jgi:predicted ATPase
MSSDFYVTEFKPIGLHVADVGPFQGRIESLDLTDSNNVPCNYYMLVSQNGRGKTTLLEVMAYLVSLLARETARKSLPPWLEDYPRARMQLDLRLTFSSETSEPGTTTVILSLVSVATEDYPSPLILEKNLLRQWDTSLLRQYGAESWHCYGYLNEMEISPLFEFNDDVVVARLRAFIREARDRSPTEFEESSESAPTLMYFPSSRDLVRLPVPEQRGISARPSIWNHRLVHRFDREGAEWDGSADHLLVWLHWLDDGKGRFSRAQQLINERLFADQQKLLKGVRKDPPEAIVVCEGSEHRLDQLSSGERNLAQLFLRLGTYMTRNTIVLIDEQDLHLHMRWQYRLVRILKRLVADHPGLTIISTSHSSDTLHAFAPEVDDPGVIKGGYIIEREVSSTEGEEHA